MLHFASCQYLRYACPILICKMFKTSLGSPDVIDDFSSSQSFGAYVDIDLLTCISPATAVRLGSINATSAVALDRNLSDHRFYFTVEGTVGPSSPLPRPGCAVNDALAYTGTFYDYAGPMLWKKCDVFGAGRILVSLRRFWAFAARRNASFAPHGPDNHSRPSQRKRLRWAKSTSAFFSELHQNSILFGLGILPGRAAGQLHVLRD